MSQMRVEQMFPCFRKQNGDECVDGKSKTGFSNKRR